MKIRTVESIAVRLPMKKPVLMAGETVAQAENVFVRLETDSGAVGWGEAAAAPTMTGETIASMMAAIELLTPKLLGRSGDDFAGATAAMDAQLYGNSGAKAAIDMALYDLIGRATGRPVYALLGAKRRSRIAVLAVIGSEDAAADLREAQVRWNAGYRAFKIKVGLGLPETDAARTMMLCQALKRQAQNGQPCLVSADANQGFSVDAALAFVGQDFARAVALVLRGGLLVGWRGHGAGLNYQALRGFSTPRDAIPVVAKALSDGRHRFGIRSQGGNHDNSTCVQCH